MSDAARPTAPLELIYGQSQLRTRALSSCRVEDREMVADHPGSIATLWLFNVAMENGPFIDGLPIKNGDFPWLC